MKVLRNKGEKGAKASFFFKITSTKGENFVMIREGEKGEFTYWGILKSYAKSLVQGRLF